MKTLKKNGLVSLLLILGASTIFAVHPAEVQPSDNETVIGNISGEQDAGEQYDLYKSSADSFRAYLAGWTYVGERDKMVTYSESQLYEKCLNEAKQQYGRYYPDLYLKDFHVRVELEHLDDEEYYSGAVGSSTKYRKKSRVKRVYTYTATVVAAQ